VKLYRLGTARRAINLVVGAMTSLGIGGQSTYLLSTKGKRTGQRRTTPVTLVTADGERWLVSPYGTVGWVHNVRAYPEVTIRRGRRAETLRAHEVSPAVAGPVLQAYLRRVRVTAPFFDAKADDPVERFVTEALNHPVFQLVAPSALR
jgi:deazaflavin-dependent oxidoreductase (nitroreductase family)